MNDSIVEEHSSPDRRPIRVLLAEDHDLLRETLAEFLHEEPDLVVVAQARDGLEAVTQAKATQPDVVLMDFSMPGLNGNEATRRILAFSSQIRVIGFSMHETGYISAKMATAGVAAYVAKGESPDQIVRVIRHVHAAR